MHLSEEEPVSPERFRSAIRERVGVRLPTVTPPNVFTARQRLAKPFARRRIVLVGDAAHEVGPIGGQAMNLGWLDAVSLAQDLVDALDGDGDDPAPFGRYAQDRHAAARTAMRRAAFNMALGAPASGLRLRARNTVARLLAHWPLRSSVADAFTVNGL